MRAQYIHLYHIEMLLKPVESLSPNFAQYYVKMLTVNKFFFKKKKTNKDINSCQRSHRYHQKKKKKFSIAIKHCFSNTHADPRHISLSLFFRVPSGISWLFLKLVLLAPSWYLSFSPLLHVHVCVFVALVQK